MPEPVFVNATITDAGTDGTDSSAYDVGAGTDRTFGASVMLFDQSFTDPITLDTITYNSVGLTVRETVEHQYAGGNRTVKLWICTLDDPASGSNTRVATISEGGDNMYVHDWHLTGANNGVGTNTAETGGNLSDHEYDITGTDVDGLHVQSGMMGGAGRTITPGTGTTVQAEGPSATPESWTATESSSGGVDTVGVTLDTSVRSVSAIIEILPSAAAPTSAVKDILGGGVIPFER